MRSIACRWLLWTLAAVVSAPIPAAGARDVDTTGAVPLRVQLEGLSPEPRIAYLRYLIDEGSVDPEVYFQLAVAFHESGEPDSAIRYYGESVRRSGDYSKAYVNIGVIYDERGLWSQALEMFELAMAVDSTDVLAHAHAAFMRFELDDYQTAWRYLAWALALDPDDPQSRFYLAVFFWESTMYREALREWVRVTELDGEGFLARKARENIVSLQKALNAPSPSESWKPKR